MGLFSSKPKNITPEYEEISIPDAPITTNATPIATKQEPIISKQEPISISNNQINNQNTINPVKMNQANTIISAGTILEGTIKVDTELVIEGTIKGTVISKAKVILGSNGKIEGDVTCLEAEISGKHVGKLNVKEVLFLKGQAQIDGDINTGKLVIESGVKFNGKCNMGAIVNIPDIGNGASKPAPTPAAATANA
jgi:cytoskeletal protein CcmA (bactofilin family)